MLICLGIGMHGWNLAKNQQMKLLNNGQVPVREKGGGVFIYCLTYYLVCFVIGLQVFTS